MGRRYNRWRRKAIARLDVAPVRPGDRQVVANSIVGDVAAGTANAIVERIRSIRGWRRTG